MTRKLTQEEFVSRATKIHGNKYDYSKSVYVKSTIKITITCKKHGDFYQYPKKHILGAGCSKCAFKYQMSKKEFIEKAIHIHGYKYNYDKTNYSNNKNKVTITCPKHGDFEQIASNHLQGHGCKYCCYQMTSDRIRWNVSQFIEKAKIIYKDKYDYSEVVYVGSQTKVIIFCPSHGKFEQTPDRHLSGTVGCRKCAGELISMTKRMPQDSFVQKVRQVHGDKYDYSKIKYTSLRDKIIIICPMHGEFEQEANSHLRGSGCPECASINRARIRRLENDMFIMRAKKVHRNKYTYDRCIYGNNNLGKVIITCPKHGDFRQTANSHLCGVGCPICKESKGENKIANTLWDLKLSFERQARFYACRYKNPMPFDFLVNVDKGLLIEYQGRQHYEAVRWNKRMNKKQALTNYENIKIRDEIKQQWAVEQHIPLLIIPYWDIGKIPSLIKKFVKENIME